MLKRKKESPKEEEVNQSLGLYIHIPFCKYICTYCDFCKKNIKYYDTAEYVLELIKELDSYKELFGNVNTIYIGGGTPSSLPKDVLQKLFDYLNQNINFNSILEYTIEVNPDDIKEISDVEFLAKNNINRVSLGVQTPNDLILEEIGRKHNKEDITRALSLLNKHIQNINIDLMFNLPEQTLKDIKASFNFIKEHKELITHISYYSLILEEDTVLYNEEYSHFTEDEEDDIYKMIQRNLQELDYNQYEISNFSKVGYESKHNLKYWLRKEYIGAGLGASGFLNNLRYTNTKSYKDYIEGVNKEEFSYLQKETLTESDEIQERIMLGLRLIDGVETAILDPNIIDKNRKYLNVTADKVSIKKDYFFLSNMIILDFLE